MTIAMRRAVIESIRPGVHPSQGCACQRADKRFDGIPATRERNIEQRQIGRSKPGAASHRYRDGDRPSPAGGRQGPQDVEPASHTDSVTKISRIGVRRHLY